ncbi:hypothetical protein MARI_29520 [Marinobacter sp. JH2]|uniref:type VI secretion system-associated FHA domain protein TagH n=1 Tax=Marinobacter sp. AL4B TaxID=2871173 RepID=UPI00105555EC|nr:MULTISPECIES: type VI secretion system-associated FHA domain protein TagH [unclassified Marinobacter]MBZ0335184.1 type VI secretion system-associated FHA domain protein TagH [Marinobacter sp. AL4B]QBM18809.1 hypothetical protein MARI_29520 [Marinobacter sp. JH2]
MTTQTAELNLVITNPTEAGGGASLEHRFSANGGSIGTAANDTWRLSPHRTGAVAGHAEVRFLDGGFCLIDRSGRTYINSSSQPVGRGRRARLSHGDTVTIGRYQIRAELQGGFVGQCELSEPNAEDHRLVNADDGELLRSSQRQTLPEGREPLVGLKNPDNELHSNDPLAPWQKPEVAGDQWLARSTDVDEEYRENRDVAMGLPVNRTARNQSDQEKERQGMSDTRAPARDASRQHISGAPLLRGLQADIEFTDSEDMQLFLEEAGQTLKAVVDGLLTLHQSEDTRHQALRTRLQPLEDNPLRLGNDYHATLQTLFAAERSPVHLSAPAAVRESLDSLNHHQRATQEAIREALDAILHAFSPEALLRRFHGYRRGLKDNEDEGLWAWDMYQHYYQELRSSRQQGFERLFQEVFDQAYDQHLRQLQRENG